MHKLLKRQLSKHLGKNYSFSKKEQKLFAAISQAYQELDEDHEFYSKSFDISAEELMSKNKKLKQEIDKSREKTRQLKIFKKITIDRELKMIELKKEISKIKNKYEN